MELYFLMIWTMSSSSSVCSLPTFCALREFAPTERGGSDQNGCWLPQ